MYACISGKDTIYLKIARPMGLHYVSLSIRPWAASKMLITLESHGIF